jgi:hypothetical protein
VRDTLLALIKLQELDSHALEFERAASAIAPQVKEIDGQLNVHRTELGTLRNELEAKRKESQEAEGVIKDETAKLQKWKRRLADIRTPREYQALSREVEQGERLVRDLEEKVVALMAEIEEKQGVVAEKEGALKAKESEANGQIRELKEREAKLNRQATQARIGRSELLAKVPPNVLALYERVRERRAGVAIALASKGSCTGCNVALRPQLFVEIRKLDAVHQCPSCSRILILDALQMGTAEPSPT